MKTINLLPFEDTISGSGYENTKLDDAIIVGFGNDTLVAEEKLLLAKYLGKVDNFDSVFNLSIASLILGGHTYEKTLVLEIEAKKSEESHRHSLSGANSGLYKDYAMAYEHIAIQFCELNNLSINQKIKHWPVLQFIVSAK